MFDLSDLFDSLARDVDILETRSFRAGLPQIENSKVPRQSNSFRLLTWSVMRKIELN